MTQSSTVSYTKAYFAVDPNVDPIEQKSKLQISFNGSNWDMALRENYSQVEATVRIAISNATLVPEDLIEINSLRVGSLIVDFTILRNASTLLPDDVMLSAIFSYDYSTLAQLYTNLTNSSEVISLRNVVFTLRSLPKVPSTEICPPSCQIAVISVGCASFVIGIAGWLIKRRWTRGRRLAKEATRKWRVHVLKNEPAAETINSVAPPTNGGRRGHNAPYFVDDDGASLPTDYSSSRTSTPSAASSSSTSSYEDDFDREEGDSSQSGGSSSSSSRSPRTSDRPGNDKQNLLTQAEVGEEMSQCWSEESVFALSEDRNPVGPPSDDLVGAVVASRRKWKLREQASFTGNRPLAGDDPAAGTVASPSLEFIEVDVFDVPQDESTLFPAAAAQSTALPSETLISHQNEFPNKTEAQLASSTLPEHVSVHILPSDVEDTKSLNQQLVPVKRRKKRIPSPKRVSSISGGACMEEGSDRDSSKVTKSSPKRRDLSLSSTRSSPTKPKVKRKKRNQTQREPRREDSRDPFGDDDEIGEKVHEAGQADGAMVFSPPEATAVVFVDTADIAAYPSESDGGAAYDDDNSPFARGRSRVALLDQLEGDDDDVAGGAGASGDLLLEAVAENAQRMPVEEAYDEVLFESSDES